MPEGPEIKIEADKINAAIGGSVVDEVYFEQRRLKRFAKAIKGARVDRIETRGKAMLIRFDHQLSMYSHNQLYGRWYVRPRGEFPNSNRVLRVALHCQQMSALLYSASDIAILTERELNNHRYISRLGPDVLHESFGWQECAELLADPKFARRSLGAVYLDQTFLAGIGNYLRSEILFLARLKPTRVLASLNERETERLARATVTLSRRAYRTKGITNPPARVTALKNQGKKRGAYRFAVFARQEQACFECGETIQRIEVSGRRLYLCNACQI